jgi:hypothetical protein
MFAPLVDFFTGRSSIWKAKYGAAFVSRVDPATGLPYAASSGTSAGLADLLYTDNTGTVFVYRDLGTGAMTPVAIPAGTAYTVGANPRPWSPSTNAGTSGTTAVSIQGVANGVAVSTSIANVAATVGTASTVTTGGTIASGARSVNFFPAAAATATVNGYPLTAGANNVLEVPNGVSLPALTYTLTGGNMQILEVR